MMSKKQWLALLVVFTAYLLLGAGVFYSIEAPLEQRRRADELQERDAILRLVRAYYGSNESELLEEVARYCGRPLSTEPSDMEDLEPELWTFYNSFFFVITVVSTIGYGNLAPTSTLSRILMILYALVGIPMNGILLASLADFFSNTLVRARARHKHQSSATLLADLARYLLPGAVVFLLLPGALFAYVEDWSYDKAVYYAFVTLTTIGFGDIVAGQTSRGEDGPYLAYRVALVVWIVFGLGYLLMLLGLISRAMRGKRVARLEHALAQQLRGAEKRVARDLRYMRRVLNELYLQKLKPVYRDDDGASSASGLRARSCSEPSLAGALAALPRRNRACSEGAALAAFRHEAEGGAGGGAGGVGILRAGRRSLVRVSSDSELARIDRNATFAAPEAAVQPARLLARFVHALGAASHAQEEACASSDVLRRLHPGAAALGGGVHGFADADILRSERAAHPPPPQWWTVGACPAANGGPAHPNGWPAPPPAYADAAGLGEEAGAPAEWTWSAPSAASQLVHGLARARKVAGSAARKAAEAAGAADTTPWWPPASPAPGVGPSFDAPPGRQGKRHSVAAALFGISRWRLLRRTADGAGAGAGGGESAGRRKKSMRPASPPPRPRPKSKSVADVFFFQRPHGHDHDDEQEQEQAEARVDALLEGTSLADLFRAVDALRQRDAAARAAARGGGGGGADDCSSSSSSSSSTVSSEASGGGGSPTRRKGGKGKGKRKMGIAAGTSPPYASLTSLFVPPGERRGSLFAPPPQALLRRQSAAPAFFLSGSERRASLRPPPKGASGGGGGGGGGVAGLAARRPSAPYASLPPGGGLLGAGPRRASLRPPSPAGSLAPAPQAPAFFKRGPRRFSVRPVPNSALYTAAAAPEEAAEPPQPPPLPPAVAAPVAPLPARVRDLRTQVLQRQLSDSSVPGRRRQDSLHEIVIQKP